MIEIQANIALRQLKVTGHAENLDVCTAITMLTRASTLVAQRAYFDNGVSMIEVKESLEDDFHGMILGLRAVAELYPEDVRYEAFAELPDLTEDELGAIADGTAFQTP